MGLLVVATLVSTLSRHSLALCHFKNPSPINKNIVPLSYVSNTEREGPNIFKGVLLQCSWFVRKTGSLLGFSAHLFNLTHVQQLKTSRVLRAPPLSDLRTLIILTQTRVRNISFFLFMDRSASFDGFDF